MKYTIVIALSIMLFNCQDKSNDQNDIDGTWQLTQTIDIDGINPIGIAAAVDGLWLSDGDHNRVVKINERGTVIMSIDSLDRPMHISSAGGELLIPQYGNDLVMHWSETAQKALNIKDSLDAPAGVWKFDDEIAVADFYNNRILYSKDGENWTSFGTEGKHDGEFYYPTDVQITSDNIYVADAYNNRIQVFNKDFKFEKIIGADQNMNATTGIFVSEKNVFSTDFENDRILIFDLEGNFIQEIKDNIEKPTDLILIDGKLYVINYRNSLLNIFELK